MNEFRASRSVSVETSLNMVSKKSATTRAGCRHSACVGKKEQTQNGVAPLSPPRPNSQSNRSFGLSQEWNFKPVWNQH